MFGLDELFSKRNQRDAFAHFSAKKDGRGPDGISSRNFNETVLLIRKARALWRLLCLHSTIWKTNGYW